MPYNLGEFTLQEELDTQKQFAKASGFKDQALAPLQKAVTSLARVGSQLSSGDTNGASATLRCAAHLLGTCQGFPVGHSHLPHLRTCSEAFVTLVVGLPPLAKHVECRKVLEHVQPCNCGAHAKAEQASLLNITASKFTRTLPAFHDAARFKWCPKDLQKSTGS